MSFEGEKAPKEPQVYDLVLVAVGRSPNGKRIGAEKAGVAVTDRGFIEVDRQMRTNVPHIFAIGDIVGQPMLAHKAVHEAHVAAEAAHGEPSFFDARQIPSVAYTDPEVAWAGKTEEQCKAEGIKFGKAVFPWAASGRAIANGRDEGFTKLIFDEATHRVIGGGIVGTHAGDLISEVCLAIEMGCEPADIGKTIHPHPTLGESIGMARRAVRRRVHRPAAAEEEVEEPPPWPLKLAFEAMGDGPPVVILHGLFGSGRNWAPIAQALAGTYRLYLPDARNHGASPWAEAMSYPDMALDVLALIDRERLAAARGDRPQHGRQDRDGAGAGAPARDLGHRGDRHRARGLRGPVLALCVSAMRGLDVGRGHQPQGDPPGAGRQPGR